MSKRNPFTVPGVKGRLSHKRFPKTAKAAQIRSGKAEARAARRGNIKSLLASAVS